MGTLKPDEPAGSRLAPPWCSPGCLAANTAEKATKAVSPDQSSQRRWRQPRPLPGEDRRLGSFTRCPKGWPQRPQTIRPERLRSARTAQLPHFGQAIALIASLLRSSCSASGFLSAPAFPPWFSVPVRPRPRRHHERLVVVLDGLFGGTAAP